MKLTLDQAKNRLELARRAALEHPGPNEYKRAVAYYSSLLAQCEKRIAERSASALVQLELPFTPDK